MSTYTEQEKDDIRELFRVHDFAKVSKVEEIVTRLEADSVLPDKYFKEQFAHYRITPLPDRDAAREHLKAAVPNATDADVESVLRQTEMHGFAEADAIRTLRRQYKMPAANRVPVPPSEPSPTSLPRRHENAREAQPIIRAVPATQPQSNVPTGSSSLPLPSSSPSPGSSAPGKMALSDGVCTRSDVVRVSESQSVSVKENLEDSQTFSIPTPPRKTYRPSLAVPAAAAPGHADRSSSGPARENETSLSASPSALATATSNLRHVTVNRDSVQGAAPVLYYQRVDGTAQNSSSALPRPAGGTNDTSVLMDKLEASGGLVADLTRSMSQLSVTFSRQAVDEVMAEEVREWVAAMVGETYNAEVLAKPNFVDALRNGVVLQVLAQKMQDPPVPDGKLVIPKRTTGFFARDNVAAFLAEAKKRFRLNDAQLFTDSDLCDAKDDRHVITCLMALARIAYTQGSIQIAPSVVMIEKEIESRTTKISQREIDRIVQEAEKQESAAQRTQDDTAGDAAPSGTESGQPLQDRLSTGRSSGTAKVNTSLDAAASHEPRERSTTAAGADEAEPTEAHAGTDGPSLTPKQTNLTPTSADGVQGTRTPSKEGDSPAVRDDADEIASTGSAGEAVFHTPSRPPRPPGAGAAESGAGTAGNGSTDAAKEKKALVVWKVPRQAGEKEDIASKLPVYRSRRWDGIDVAVGNALNEHYRKDPQCPWRFHAVAANAGEYVMYNRDTSQKKVVFVRFIQRRLFVRHSQAKGGPEWVLFEDAVGRLDAMFAGR